MASVFVSHRSSDTSLAEQLAKDLQSAGHTVWLDKWELKIGDSLIGKISSGLTSAQYVVLCYSAGGIDTPWISREWMSTLTRQIEGAGVTILPVRLSGGSPPAILADIKYADLVADWNRGLAEILVALK